jgi:hypothetical protein
MTARTMSDEMDSWLATQRAKMGAVTFAAQIWGGDKEKPRTSPAWTREVDFTEAEWRFLWRRFQPVGVPLFGFARRLQCAANDVMTLSAEQRCWVLALAFKYRRKVFFSPQADRLNEAAFVHGVRELAGREAS